MNNTAIKVSGLSKVYKRKSNLVGNVKKGAINVIRDLQHKLLGDRLTTAKLKNNEEFYALRDISFEVKKGESVGIIGRNGAGKSTLLKTLSRITRPTAGNIEIHGSLSSLLEVGTGFHPELTGRENIFLNASILGLSKKDISLRFDEIVDFSGVEEFLDLPIKHYSSGMFMRLAFSVSAHLNSDVLILDEVLAVGDAAFQKKCLGKMNKVSGDGRTVLFVSHSISSIISFCSRCLMLDKGMLVKDGTSSEVVEYYQSITSDEPEYSQEILMANQNITKNATFTSVKLIPLDSKGLEKKIFRVGDDLEINANITAYKKITDNNVAVVIYDENNYRLIDVNIALKDDSLSLNIGESATVKFLLKNLLLRPGSYRISLWAGRRAIEDSDLVNNAAKLNVEIDLLNTKNFYIYDGPYQCQFFHSISIEKK